MAIAVETASVLPRLALIGGRWVEGSAGTFEVRNPYSGELVNEIARCSAADVDRAVAAAAAAQPAWAATPLIERAKVLRRINRLFVERAEPIARVLVQEIAKTITASREEVHEYAAPAWHKAAEEVLRHRGLSLPSTQEQTNNKRLVLTHRPLGVVGAITPYNFPTDISSIALAHIVGAGNTVVWKPSEFAPTSCAMVAEIFTEAGLPDGVINVVQGFGDVGAAIVEHPGVKGIFFTGSTATGRTIAVKAALKPQLLELGGDGPFVILPDADIDAAVEGAMNGCFYYGGQVCTSAERLIVHRDVHDEFVQKLKARAAVLRIGDPALDETEMGPLCNANTLQRVVDHVEDARAKGADIEQYGPQEGLFYPATVLTGVTPEMRIAQEETFGPVAPVMKVRSVAEAIEIANSSELGLIASLWTRGPCLCLAGRRGAPARVGEHQRDQQLLGPAGAVRRCGQQRGGPGALAVVPGGVHGAEAARVRSGRRRAPRPPGRGRLVALT